MTAPQRARRALPAIVAPQDLDAAAFGGEVIVPAPVMELGRGETGDAITIDLEVLLATRLLVQGMSGSGKSWLLRRILEGTAGTIQQVVIDPEGEFGTLAAAFGHLTLDATRLDAEALGEAVTQARQARRSLHVDLGQCARGRQIEAVTAVLRALAEAGSLHWHPCLVAVDEAHLFAPQGAGSGPDKKATAASLNAVIDLVGRGRKRGLCGLLATQRLGALARAVTSETENLLIGGNRQDIDIARAASAIGWTGRKADGILRVLRPGHFIATGPAFSRSPVEVRVGPVRSYHRGSTPALVPLPAPDEADAAIDVDALAAATDRRSALRQGGQNPSDAAAVRAFLAARSATTATRAYVALRLEYPLPLRRNALARSLDLGTAVLDTGLDLLIAYGFARRYGAADDPTVVAL